MWSACDQKHGIWFSTGITGSPAYDEHLHCNPLQGSEPHSRSSVAFKTWTLQASQLRFSAATSTESKIFHCRSWVPCVPPLNDVPTLTAAKFEDLRTATVLCAWQAQAQSLTPSTWFKLPWSLKQNWRMTMFVLSCRHPVSLKTACPIIGRQPARMSWCEWMHFLTKILCLWSKSHVKKQT